MLLKPKEYGMRTFLATFIMGNYVYIFYLKKYFCKYFYRINKQYPVLIYQA